MRLVIDTRNGIAGDIACAGLLGLGADQEKIIKAMEYAGDQIGTATITPLYHDSIVRLKINLGSDQDHLYEAEAKRLLNRILEHLRINEDARMIAKKILGVLCDAERYVHSHDSRLKYMLHHNCDDSKAILHEAKDILLDVTGFAIGLQELGIDQAYYLDFVNVGNGTLTFSHGAFEVPAPATEHILKKHKIAWQKSDEYGEEMTTPTGASILAGCGAKRIAALNGPNILKKSQARGMRKGLPPVSFYLAE